MPRNPALTVSAGLLLAVVLLLFSLGCSSGQKNQVDVKIYDLITGNPIQGATVEIYSSNSLVKTAKTGQDGIATIDNPGGLIAAQQGSQNYFTVDAYSDSYPIQTKTNVDLSQATSLTFQLERVKAQPIPASRFYEDSVISDSIPNPSQQGNYLTLLIYKVILDDSGQAQSALFRLQRYGNTLMTKKALAGDDLRNVIVDDNGDRVLPSMIIVKSIGFDDARQLGYADIIFSK